jgi:hypothetical protein
MVKKWGMQFACLKKFALYNPASVISCIISLKACFAPEYSLARTIQAIALS